MAQKDYYLILGVPRTETMRGIQKAFRELAKQHHPDRMGAQGTAAFQEIVEAYETLSDPRRRRDYDDRTSRVGIPVQSRPEPVTPRTRSRPEPLIPEPLSILHDFGMGRPSFEALRARLRRNFTGRDIPKGERLESLNLEVQLRPDEARRGGVMHIGVPVFSPCPTCLGSGRDRGFFCLPCMGQGVIEAEERVAVRIPPRVPPGTVLEMPLHGAGIRNFYLRLHIVVTSWV